MFFISFSEKKISCEEYNIFVVKIKCVFCEAGAERLNSAQTSLMLQRFEEITNV